MGLIVNSSRGQIKIQQMAFVLVAVMIFFAMVALLYVSLRSANVDQSAVNLREEEARIAIRTIASTPEFSFSVGNCANCVDFDKIYSISQVGNYEEFWNNFDYLAVEKTYPEEDSEICEGRNYPFCSKIEVIDKEVDEGNILSTYVSVCRWENKEGGYYKCELGRILASGEGIR